ncbi:MAG: hypothetical protein ACK5KQ_03610 [Anaerorhabdus sp.]
MDKYNDTKKEKPLDEDKNTKEEMTILQRMLSGLIGPPLDENDNTKEEKSLDEDKNTKEEDPLDEDKNTKKKPSFLQTAATTLIGMPSFIKIIKVFILICILSFLISKSYYVLATALIVLTSFLTIMKYFKQIKKYISTILTDRKNIKKLQYYHITDNDKLIDVEKKQKKFSLFNEVSLELISILMVNFVAIYIMSQQLFEKSAVLVLIDVIVLGLLFFILFFGNAKFFYKHNTATFVMVPVVSVVIYFMFIAPLISFLPDFIGLACYLFITIILYLILAYFFPAHYLRKLNSKTVLISSVTVILAIFLFQILEFNYSNSLQYSGDLITITEVKNSTDITDTFKNIVLDNPILVETTNQVLSYLSSSVISSITEYILTALTVSYIVGSLIINEKIKKNNAKAKRIYRDIKIKESIIDYETLKKCSYYGGEYYENLLLNNDTTKNIIIINEREHNIPNASSKPSIKER